jgi:hypothetical protein
MRAHAAHSVAQATCVAPLPRPRATASPAQGRGVGAARGLAQQLRLPTGLRCPTNGTRCTAFFNFRQDSKTAGACLWPLWLTPKAVVCNQLLIPPPYRRLAHP